MCSVKHITGVLYILSSLIIVVFNSFLLVIIIFIFGLIYFMLWASQVVLVVKNPPAKEGDTRDEGLILGLGRIPGIGNGNLSSMLAWKIAWAEEPGGLQCMGPQKLDTTQHSTFVLYIFCVFYLPRLLKCI